MSPQQKEQKMAILAQKIKASDEEAFSELFYETFPRLVKFAWRYTQTKSSAKDIVQESFVKLWEARAAIDPGRSLLAYLFQIVRNRSLNYLRDHASKNISIDDLPRGALRSTEETTEDATEPDKSGKEMLNWIDRLPDRQREAIRLSRFEGLDHDEIAYVMDISPRTVNNHIVAALKTLKKEWNNYTTTKPNGVCYEK